ncbi:MAG: GtrA family protein [Ruminococcus sp.]|nr:GtrA family protein [Ruminococcus sp.]
MNRLILWFVKHMPKKIQEIYFKHEEIWLYLFYGALTTLVSMITKLVPLYLADPEAMGSFYTIYSGGCATFSWICAVTFAFFTNRAYVFKSTARTKKEFWREFVNFYVGRLASWFIDLGITMVFIGYLKWNEFWVTLASQIIILIINYVISKLFVFRKTESTDKAEAASAKE